MAMRMRDITLDNVSEEIGALRSTLQEAKRKVESLEAAVRVADVDEVDEAEIRLVRAKARVEALQRRLDRLSGHDVALRAAEDRRKKEEQARRRPPLSG